MHKKRLYRRTPLRCRIFARQRRQGAWQWVQCLPPTLREFPPQAASGHYVSLRQRYPGGYAHHIHEIAVVVTDMSMPLMDGPNTIRALIRINPDINIIAASGCEAGDGVAQISGPNVQHFLTKPYTAETLLKTLRTILDEN